MSNSPPISIGTSFKIGSGSYKTVYACDITDADNEIFVLPENANVDKLCIAVVNIFKLVGDKFGKHKESFFNYVNQSTQMKRGNKYRDAFEPEIKYETDKFIDEINFQKEFFKNRLAPQIYEYKIDEGKMYILQEKCGISLNTYIDLYSEQLQGVSENDNGTYNYNGIILNNLPYIDENVFEKIVNLTVRIAENGYINTDMKSANTCTKIAPNGLLIDIIALDFDPSFFIKIDLSNKELVDNAQIFMLTLFLAHLSKWRDIKFVQSIVEKHLNYEKIQKMVTFFANNSTICDKAIHPFYMIYHYIIGFGDVIETSCANNRTEEKIKKITDKLCKCIFFEVKSGDAKGNRKTKRVKRTKRYKRSKKSRK
jgi:hypothetical protein